MSKPDLLICWHESCDYPVFRKTLAHYRDFFGKVIIYLSKHHREPVYSDFLKEAMADLNITFLDPIEYQYGVEDWRNVATNHMLKFSDSEWVCSIEQDWFAVDWEKLLNTTRQEMDYSDMIGWMNETTHSYVHPSYWFIKRDLLDKTSKDFSAHPEIDGCDHFGMITYDAQKLGAKISTLQDMGFNCNVTPDADCFHQGGINQNYLEGLKDDYVFHRPLQFYVYNYWSLAIRPLDPRFKEIMEKLHDKLHNQFLDYKIEYSEWSQFYI